MKVRCMSAPGQCRHLLDPVSSGAWWLEKDRASNYRSGGTMHMASGRCGKGSVCLDDGDGDGDGEGESHGN